MPDIREKLVLVCGIHGTLGSSCSYLLIVTEGSIFAGTEIDARKLSGLAWWQTLHSFGTGQLDGGMELNEQEREWGSRARRSHPPWWLFFSQFTQAL